MGRALCTNSISGLYQWHYHWKHLPPPYDDNNKGNISTSIISELDLILSSISATRKDLIITRNFNINSLHIYLCNKEHYGDFLDQMLGHSLIPTITLPTRMAENSCSLIDEIFYTLSRTIFRLRKESFTQEFQNITHTSLTFVQMIRSSPITRKKCKTKAQHWGSIWKPETRIAIM